jgi:hypothetical protein
VKLQDYCMQWTGKGMGEILPQTWSRRTEDTTKFSQVSCSLHQTLNLRHLRHEAGNVNKTALHSVWLMWG